MTRIIIFHIRKCHRNFYEVAGGYELKIAQSGFFFVCVRCRETKIVLTLGTFFHLTSH